MTANFLRILGITTLTLILVVQAAMPAVSAVPAGDNRRERPMAFEPTPTPTPGYGQCSGTTCG